MTGPLALELVVDGATTPIRGTIAMPGRAPVTFIGWTDLFSRLREVVEDDAALAVASDEPGR
jgi:hypothetical protein